jgi:hypothetical protein
LHVAREEESSTTTTTDAASPTAEEEQHQDKLFRAVIQVDTQAEVWPASKFVARLRRMEDLQSSSSLKQADIAKTLRRAYDDVRNERWGLDAKLIRTSRDIYDMCYTTQPAEARRLLEIKDTQDAAAKSLPKEPEQQQQQQQGGDEQLSTSSATTEDREEEGEASPSTFDWTNFSKPEEYVWYLKADSPRGGSKQNQVRLKGQEEDITVQWNKPITILAFLFFVPLFSAEFFFAISRQFICYSPWTADLCNAVPDFSTRI